MKTFGIHDSEIVPLIEAVVGRTVEPAAARELFARAAWSGLVEPGDRTAGALIGALGAVPALTALVERWSAGRISDQVAQLGDSEVTIDDVEKGVARWMPRLDASAATLALRQAARHTVRLVVPRDASWPAGMDDLGLHAPIALWVRGRPDVLATLGTSIALVGARAATGYGEHITMEASAGLVDRGYTIVSGAAYGIDGMAHRAALASRGLTVAFLAGGVDRFYPSGHDALLTRIAEEGAVISELPCGAQPSKWRFLQRNRLIAAASQATVVLEAGWRSGSLNTAGHAAALGRPLGAVPGPVTSAASAGCHRLIRDFDAVCVTNPDEMAELAPLNPAPAHESTATGAHSASERDATSTRLFDALSVRSPRSAADIAARSGLSIIDVQAHLGSLELEGRVRERERGWLRVADRGQQQ